VTERESEREKGERGREREGERVRESVCVWACGSVSVCVKKKERE